MPRGRPPKKDLKKQEQNTENEQQDYFMQFSRSFQNAIGSSMFYNSPFIQNEILKNINMTPHKLNRDEVEKLVANPKANEKAIRDLAQYLENYIMHFKRLVFHYGSILTFDYYLLPTNADEDDKKSNAYKKSYNKAFDWLEKFHIKETLANIMRMLVLEDAKFYYLRESEARISLQEMPSDWCKIVAKTDFGYQYSFNMMYFLQTGVNLDDYAPEFKEYFTEYSSKEEYKNRAPYWIDLDPVKAPVFKFDENRAGILPPLMGIFIDSTEIATYKELLKTKTKLEVWKILLSKIPMHNDGKGPQAKNNFAIDADTAAKFNSIIQSAVPEGVKSIVTPFDSEAVDFDQSQSKNSIVGVGEEMFYKSAGTSPILFGEKNTTGSGIKASIETDESFVLHMYREFERFLNIQLKRVTGRFRFKVVFPDITFFNRKDKIEEYLKVSQYGMPVSLLACALGLNQRDLVNLLEFESILKIHDKLKPLVSSHTQNGNENSGRPKQNKLTDAGEQTRDIDANQNR
ncbi:hypothetical protein [Paenibacillus oleatilyticus]|uniref:hypothetical protein n=1 Tax=Paenibacillus oleatilyticus TaxID=2594886 RepID=UPI001C1FC600|nr:hypothetical protein [Paenibacillus oleatilyticus]MBU7316136.1 hypothetical protein [Paenibacillus oleatilyticus]